MKIANILNNPTDFTIGGKLWIMGGEERFFGPGRIELLENIEKTGSINKAAKAMNMSYKKAWEMIHSMNKQTNMPMVITFTGGKEGGGAEITNEARALITYFKAMHQRFRDFLAHETQQLFEN
ncbi:MAG: winged helix-turn-helix domain-containing protein [Saprospiraceae bacterium]